MEDLQQQLEHYKTGYEQANSLCTQLMEMTENLQGQVETLESENKLIRQQESEKFNEERMQLKKNFLIQLSELKEQYQQEQQQIANTIRSENQRNLDVKEKEIQQLQGQLARLFEHYSPEGPKSTDPNELEIGTTTSSGKKPFKLVNFIKLLI